MKIVTKLTVVATLATFMFAGISLTWGNAYSQHAVSGDLVAKHSWGVWMDVNDSMAFGWEGSGLKVGFAGPAGMTVRLGFDPKSTYDHDADGTTDEIPSIDIATSLGMSRAWWTSTGDGWGTSLSTAIDWGVVGTGEGDFTLTMNLGFGF